MQISVKSLQIDLLVRFVLKITGAKSNEQEFRVSFEKPKLISPPGRFTESWLQPRIPKPKVSNSSQLSARGIGGVPSFTGQELLNNILALLKVADAKQVEKLTFTMTMNNCNESESNYIMSYSLALHCIVL